MINHWLLTGTLACLLGTALWCDFASRRIPNKLVVVGLVAGSVANFLTARSLELDSPLSGVQGLGTSLLGALAGLAVMLPLYLCRAMGGGDVKLMAAVGTFLGPLPTLGAALLAFVTGGVLSLVVALWSGSLMRVLNNLRLMGMLALSHRSSGLSHRDVQTTGRLPYALAITTGTLLQVWLATQSGWPFK